MAVSYIASEPVRGGTFCGCEVVGKLKAGAAYGYTKVLGYHPILATRADTGEILHARLRKGSANTRPRRQTFRRRADRPGPPGRSDRSDRVAIRLGVLVPDTIAALRPPRHPLQHVGASHHQSRRRAYRPHPRQPGPPSTTAPMAKPKSLRRSTVGDG